MTATILTGPPDQPPSAPLHGGRREKAAAGDREARFLTVRPGLETRGAVDPTGKAPYSARCEALSKEEADIPGIPV
jgi:hypothetical protein